MYRLIGSESDDWQDTFEKKILETSHGRRTIETLQRWVPELATKEYVNDLEGRLALEKEGVVVLPGVMDLLQSIPAEDWTVNTAGTNLMATTRLKQFEIQVPKQMATGDMVRLWQRARMVRDGAILTKL